MSVPTGKIMMLQGASSAGKTTLAKALQRELDEYWWMLEADAITYMQPVWQNGAMWEPTPGERPHASWDPNTRLERWYDGYWQCLATIAKTGSNVIAVGGWLGTDWLYQFASAIDGLDAYCVGVYCPLDELAKREKARGDRWLGYAESHIETVHLNAPYDCDTDTSKETTKQSVHVIRQMLIVPPKAHFFERIRASDGYRDWDKKRAASV